MSYRGYSGSPRGRGGRPGTPSRGRGGARLDSPRARSSASPVGFSKDPARIPEEFLFDNQTIKNFEALADAVGKHEDLLQEDNGLIMKMEEIPINPKLPPSGDRDDTESESEDEDGSSGDPGSMSEQEWNFEEDLRDIVRRYPGCSLEKKENGVFMLRGPRFDPEYDRKQHRQSGEMGPGQKCQQDTVKVGSTEAGASGGALHLQFKNIKGSLSSYDVSSVLSPQELTTNDEKHIRILFKRAMAKEKGRCG